MRRPVRLLLFPILILVVAGVISWVSERSRTLERAAVAAFTEQFLDGGPVGATEPLLLQSILRRLPTDATLTVEVRDGDGGPAPDGAASHVVIVRANGLAAVGLRCRYDSDPAAMAFVGVFEPGTGAPTAATP